MPPATTTVHDLLPPHAARAVDGLPLAARLKAEPGWNALAYEYSGTRPTGRVRFLPVTAWGLVLGRRVTQSPPLAALTAAVVPGLPVEALVPLDAGGQRLTSLRGFLLLSPPGEDFTQAIERAEKESEAVRALLPETQAGEARRQGESACPRDLPCGRIDYHFDDECLPAPVSMPEGGA